MTLNSIKRLIQTISLSTKGIDLFLPKLKILIWYPAFCATECSQKVKSVTGQEESAYHKFLAVYQQRKHSKGNTCPFQMKIADGMSPVDCRCLVALQSNMQQATTDPLQSKIQTHTLRAKDALPLLINLSHEKELFPTMMQA